MSGAADPQGLILLLTDQEDVLTLVTNSMKMCVIIYIGDTLELVT